VVAVVDLEEVLQVEGAEVDHEEILVLQVAQVIMVEEVFRVEEELAVEQIKNLHTKAEKETIGEDKLPVIPHLMQDPLPKEDYTPFPLLF